MHSMLKLSIFQMPKSFYSYNPTHAQELQGRMMLFFCKSHWLKEIKSIRQYLRTVMPVRAESALAFANRNNEGGQKTCACIHI